MAHSDDEHTSNAAGTPAGLESQAANAGEHKPSGMTRVVRDRKGARKVVEVPSTGHSWDGIEEYDNPLPRWWLWTFYATIIWGIGYLIAYPAITYFRGLPCPVPGESRVHLTEREKQVVRLAAAGLTSREIAQSLGISVRTTNQHIDNVGNKLATRNRAHTVAEAMRLELLA